jgi:hypothetical protein
VLVLHHEFRHSLHHGFCLPEPQRGLSECAVLAVSKNPVGAQRTVHFEQRTVHSRMLLINSIPHVNAVVVEVAMRSVPKEC